jgi:hypothetical protein
VNTGSNNFDYGFRKISLIKGKGKANENKVRYILAKLCQYADETAFGNQRKLENYFNTDTHIEHILPKVKSSLVDFDKLEEYDVYVSKLGNLTLLEKTINLAASNQNFAYKKNMYAQSSILLTKTLSQESRVGINTSFNSVVSEFKPYNEWGTENINDRQEKLLKLAKKVWSIP